MQIREKIIAKVQKLPEKFLPETFEAIEKIEETISFTDFFQDSQN